VRDVLRADRLLGEATLKRGTERHVAVRLQELVQPLDLVDPRPRTSVGQLGQIRESGGPEID
jgi:hypothetical protein